MSIDTTEILHRFAVIGGTCDITDRGVARVQPYFTEVCLTAYDLASMLLMACRDDHAEAMRKLAAVMSMGHTFAAIDDDIDPF